MIRKPIVTVVGHVDHGKTSLLDTVRNTTVTEGEAGKITQAIGASIIPIETIKRVCGDLLQKLELTIPGLLFIDTPGHAAFSTLRKRGGNLADIAIVVVDINEGLKPQTKEAIEILKAAKTPFIIAANKIDLLQGWEKKDNLLIKNISSQSPQTTQLFETKFYELVGQLHEEFELQADRFDRVQDYTKQIAIVPLSAITSEGIPELLMVLIGLVQKYLEQNLEIDTKNEAKGTILEVKEQKGIGKVLDAIIYDGTISIGDQIVIGGVDGPIVTKVRGLFEPAPLSEIMEKKTKYVSVKSVEAATGVRIVAPDIDNVVSGMPLVTSKNDLEASKKEVQDQINEVMIETDTHGLIIKADTLGSLEALIFLLKEKEIPIRKATIGDVKRKDLIDAESNLEKDPLFGVILAFNVSGESSDKIKVITSSIIYQIIEDYEKWKEEQTKLKEKQELSKVTYPCRIEIMKGYVFRQSNPLVTGVSVQVGKLKAGMPLMNKEGKEITQVKGLQEDQKSISEAEKGKEVACSMSDVTMGRQVNEGDILYSSLSEEDFQKLKEFKHLLEKEDIELLKEIALIRRKNNPVWGI